MWRSGKHILCSRALLSVECAESVWWASLISLQERWIIKHMHGSASCPYPNNMLEWNHKPEYECLLLWPNPQTLVPFHWGSNQSYPMEFPTWYSSFLITSCERKIRTAFQAEWNTNWNESTQRSILLTMAYNKGLGTISCITYEVGIQQRSHGALTYMIYYCLGYL